MVELTIPNEWLKVNISDLADVDLGKTPKKTDYLSAGDYKVVKFRDVDYSGIDWSIDKDGFVGDKSISDLRELQLHDVLITASAHSSEHIGKKICFVTNLPKDYKKIYFCGELLGIRSKDNLLSPKFCFYYFLSHTGYKEIQSHVKGVHLTSGQARNMSIPFTPPLEQNSIIEIVEELFSDLDSAIENLKKAQEQLKVYRRAVLKYAFTGKLSNDGNVWETKPLGQVCHVVSGNTPKGVNEIYSMGEIPFYKVSDMNTEGNEAYLRKSKINLSANDCKKLKLKTYPAGTVVFPKRGGAILTNKKRILSKESAFDLNLMGVVSNDNVLERFLFNWFLLLDLGKLCDGSNVPQINHGDIEPLDFPLVPTEVQQKVIGEIEARLSVCKNMEDALDENLCKAEALRQSILSQAFEGNLTEQWRKEHKDLISGENSAESLLKKIKAGKEALQVKSKGKEKHD